ncbi:MAG: magnesium transporter [Candidatus Eisenbacteria bacterium]
MGERDSIIGPEITGMLEEGRFDAVRDFLSVQNPYDIAEFIGELEPPVISRIVLLLGDPLGPDTFQKLDTEVQVEVLQIMPRPDNAHLIERMDPDERVDLIKALPEEVAERILPMLAQAKRNEIAKLVTYEEGTAGSVMTTEYAAVSGDLTIGGALGELRRIAPDRDTLYNVFVVDNSRQLVGVIPLKDLFVLPSLASVKDVMKGDVKSVDATADVEEVVRVAKDYDLVSVPVVDSGGKLLGIVTHDDVVDVVVKETTEDMYHFGAAGEHLRYLPTNPFRLARERVVWLILLAAVGFISGMIVHRYESMITTMFALAIFIPVINASGGNAGTQASTVIIRGLATGEVTLSDSVRIFWKEIVVGLTIGVVVALVGALRGFVLENNIRLAVTVGLAMVAVVTFATVLGAVLPLAFKKLRLDPAVVSGPFIASVLDVVALIIYLEIARFVLKL